MRIAPVTISFFSLDNSVQLIAQLKQHVSELIPIIIDNNPREEEYGYDEVCARESRILSVNQRVIYKRNTWEPDIKVRSHGLGMDFALDFCKQYNFDWMLHIEPDCKVFGREWYDQLIEIAPDYDVIAIFKTSFGPIQPCLSLWRVRSIKHSFKLQSMNTDHPRFNELVSIPNLLKETGMPKGYKIKLTWDTAQKNWFAAAVLDRCIVIGNPGDIAHIGWSSKRF